jgi:hypothetical protein
MAGIALEQRYVFWKRTTQVEHLDVEIGQLSSLLADERGSDERSGTIATDNNTSRRCCAIFEADYNRAVGLLLAALELLAIL